MRALILAADDVGGCLAHLAHELRLRGVAQARVVSGQVDPVARFEVDIGAPLDGGAEARDWLETCEALHLVDLHPDGAALFGRPVSEVSPRPGLLQIDRAPEASWRELADAGRARGLRVVTTRPAVAAATGAQLMAPFIPLWRGPWRPLAAGTRQRESVRRPGVVFASSRTALRRRPRLERLVDDADLALRPGQKLDTVVGLAQREVLRRRRYAHVVLTEGEHGLALSAFEALAQGVAVVADTPRRWIEAHAASVGVPAPVRSPEDLSKVLDGIAPRDEADPALRAWAERALDPARWLSLCAEAYAAKQNAA